MRVNVGDVSLFFDVDGAKLEPEGALMREKPTIVLLHGGPGFDHSGFKPLFSRLREAAQIVYLDLRGHGRSDEGQAQSWCLRQWAADLEAFCRKLEIVKPVILGLSFGCEVAMSYALTYPDGIGKLILVSGTARLRLDRSFAVFRRLGGAEIEAIAREFWLKPSPEAQAAYFERCLALYGLKPVDPVVAKRAIFNEAVAAHYNRPGGEAQTVDLLPELNRISCPVLILAGEDDPITTAEDARDIAAAIGPARAMLHCLSGCRHNVFRDQPDLALELIRDFLTV